MKKKGVATKQDPIAWMDYILVLIGLWLIFVGITYVYTLHPVAGIVCIIAGVALILYYFMYCKKK